MLQISNGEKPGMPLNQRAVQPCMSAVPDSEAQVSTTRGSDDGPQPVTMRSSHKATKHAGPQLWILRPTFLGCFCFVFKICLQIAVLFN